MDTQAGEWIWVWDDKLSGETYALDEFFPILKERFIQMEWVPKFDYIGGIEGGSYCYMEESERTRDILRHCGWPGEEWNRAGFDSELEEWRNRSLYGNSSSEGGSEVGCAMDGEDNGTIQAASKDRVGATDVSDRAGRDASQVTEDERECDGVPAKPWSMV